MRIVIDLQGAQSTGSRRRGIGRYSFSLAQAIARRARGHEIVLALNGCYSDTIDELRTAFDGLIDPRNFRIWYAAPHLIGPNGRRAQEKLYEAFLSSLQPDVVHVTSLFEGLGDPTVTSVGSFTVMPTSVTLYDLIPLINPDLYLDHSAVRGWYMRKVAALQRANMWLAISESARQEGITYLGFNPERCINVSTATSDHFRKLVVSSEREKALREQYGLHKPFVMYNGGIEHRKNVDGLIKAFALLSGDLRGDHQLAIVCTARPEDRARLLELASQQGLAHNDVVITGFVPEQDLVDLYNLCTLFVFPSWHEGFGLPALEAMQCGAAVIGANTSSIPEVIGRDDAMFDPRDVAAIANKMAQALTDQGFRSDLAQHGLDQAKKFSWDESARRAIAGLEALHASTPSPRAVGIGFQQPRPRLAYVSPLPPEPSAIARYSAEVLPELARYYDIDLITGLSQVEDPVLAASFAIRSVDWFRKNAGEFDRVVYHVGNSNFYQHMLALLADHPGIVVLHDFYLGGIQTQEEQESPQTSKWARALYESHGYPAVADFLSTADLTDIIFKYPCNFDVLRHAQGVIVHSPFAMRLAEEWFGETIAPNWALAPVPHALPRDSASRRAKAREQLGLGVEDILVCAFGSLSPTKLNDRLLQAWLASSLAKDSRCKLVFVGGDTDSSYGIGIKQEIEAGRCQIRVTGRTDADLFQCYLSAADIAVHLQAASRGGTSHTVVEAMSHGVATIVNANGSMGLLPSDAAWVLPDDFSDLQLIEALERLRNSADTRSTLGGKARELIRSEHAPATSARRHADAIESFAFSAARGRDGLIQAIGQSDLLTTSELTEIAQSIALTLPLPSPERQLFVDVSQLVNVDSQSGIQRMVKSLLKVLFDAPPAGYRVEPVYADLAEAGYKYARKFTLAFLGCPVQVDGLEDAPIDFRRDDVFVGLDLQTQIVPRQRAFYQKLRHVGVRVEFVVYDLLPVLLSERFRKDSTEGHAQWLHTVAENDGALCISQAVADELASWIAENTPERKRAGFNIRAFHLGAELSLSKPTTGLPLDAATTLTAISSTPSFLMVGTVEPRKGVAQALDAFEQLWLDKALRINLVIVGRQGWMVEELVDRLREHPERGTRLFWLENASDEYLERVYASAACLIAASEGEGFGLPLIEAARHKLPIIARDLPVFREVAGTNALYFNGGAPALADTIVEWLDLFSTGNHPRSETMPYLTWQQSAEQFKAALFEQVPAKPWTSNCSQQD